MKIPKFLKNLTDLLRRSFFNPSKCKTSLRLAMSRMKLLRNKRDVQVKQMKREIAKLLESGQDRTARIRVEHVIREEKMMAAYDLIEIYCELLVARLPIIDSQKVCPIDLKEAVTSLIFASTSCGDVPELLVVGRQFKKKYGKDFTTAAVELRPECGVRHLLVEKLSAVAPDGPFKMKILSAIAKEYNVKWDANSFEEKDSVPTSELLTGPINFGKERNSKVQTYGVNTAFQHEARPRDNEKAQLFQGDKRSWNMEFKDVASAARAAAESAELASMAARAAALLSIREQFSEEPINRSFSEPTTSLHNERIDGTRPNSMETERRIEDGRVERKEYYSRYTSLKSKASTDNDSEKALHFDDSVNRKSTSFKILETPKKPVNSENVKATTLTKTCSNKDDDSNQKASHVHPKLPDYDTLVQSLRKNRT